MVGQTAVLDIPDHSAGLALGVILAIVALVWMRHLTEPGPLLRGEARWRYRHRCLRERLDRALATPILPSRTRGWWLTRLEFAVALGLLALVVATAAAGDVRTVEPARLFTTGLGVAGMLVGLAWMVRIYRAGLRDDAEARWRYRDR